MGPPLYVRGTFGYTSIHKLRLCIVTKKRHARLGQQDIFVVDCKVANA